MADLLYNILSLIGALGLFIFGMKIMIEAIQKFAGARLRRTLRSMTAKKSRGILYGLGVTSILQSSSATTVMIISFVNAGLITVEHSVGLIMGANIGTTITAWLVSILGMGKLSIGHLSLPLLAFGFPLLFLGKEKLRNYGEALFGFAILFIGLGFMRDAMPAWEANEALLEFLKQFDFQPGNWLQNLVVGALFVGLGIAATFLLQSSSAAMALTLVFTANGLISFPLAAAIILGENIGTTFTANIAALVANVHARRAAFTHLLFNVFGVVWALLLLAPFLNFIAYLSTLLFGADPMKEASVIPLSLSLFHSVFNLINVLLFYNLTRFLVKIARLALPTRRKEDEHFSLDFIGSNLLSTPELSLIEARKELVKFGDLIRKAYKYVPLLITEMDEKKLDSYGQKLLKYEDIADRKELEVSVYLSKISQSDLSSAASSRVRSMLHIASYLERIGDIYLEVSRNLKHRKQQKAYFTPEMRKQVMLLSELVSRSLDLMVKNLEAEGSENHLEEAQKLERDVDQLFQRLKSDYMEKVEKGKFRIQSGMYYSDLLTEMARIASHASSISQSISKIDSAS
ncbi:MAG: Na/Pi cotransporter family protein [Bacteroidetes bacterium]|nr:Na/Pi cotransporter family protein [Bacteroidota bacterium]